MERNKSTLLIFLIELEKIIETFYHRKPLHCRKKYRPKFYSFCRSQRNWSSGQSYWHIFRLLWRRLTAKFRQFPWSANVPVWESENRCEESGRMHKLLCRFDIMYVPFCSSCNYLKFLTKSINLTGHTIEYTCIIGWVNINVFLFRKTPVMNKNSSGNLFWWVIFIEKIVWRVLYRPKYFFDKLINAMKGQEDGLKFTKL